jgi:hypothetical protein
MSGIKRTIWARRNRGVFNGFVGVRLLGERYDRLKLVAALLNIDVSDLIRAMVDGITSIPLETREIGANPGEIKPSAKVNPPTTSDKIRYV